MSASHRADSGGITSWVPRGARKARVTAGWYPSLPGPPVTFRGRSGAGGSERRVLVVARLAQGELDGAGRRVGGDGEDPHGGPAGGLAVDVDGRAVDRPLGPAHDVL